MKPIYKKLWSSFSGFRKVMASALRKVGAPKELYQEVGDTSIEGTEMGEVLYNAFQCAEDYIKDDPEFGWNDALNVAVYDAVLEICGAYKNSWNYPPGHKPKKLDTKELCAGVINTLSADSLRL